jgi:hypothetical protein
MSQTQTKFSKTLREIPGKKQTHYGIFNDPKEYENNVHGLKTADSDHLKDCIYGTNLNGAKYFINKMKEQKYVRTQKEPLGKTLQRNYVFPEEVKKEVFKFGVPTQGGKYFKINY